MCEGRCGVSKPFHLESVGIASVVRVKLEQVLGTIKIRSPEDDVPCDASV